MWGALRTDVRQLGLLSALYVRLLHLVRRGLGLQLVRVIVRTLREEPPGWTVPAGMCIRVLTADELRHAANDPGLEMAPEFVEEALARGDHCRGLLEDGKVIATAWFTNAQTVPHDDRVWVETSRPYQYGYKIQVHRDRRGRELAGFVSAFGDGDRLAAGFTHALGFIALDNVRSLRAGAKRPAWDTCGYCAYFVWGRRVLCVRSPAVKRTGLRFVAAPAA